MAGEQQSNTPSRVTTEFSTGDSQASVDMSLVTGKASTSNVNLDAGQASAVELDQQTGKTHGQRGQQQQPEGGEGQAEGQADQEQNPQSTEPPEAALPDFDPENAEVRAQYDQRYFTDEGKLNLGQLTKEFWANAGKDGKSGKLSDGTYKYLEAQVGITMDAVQTIERGLVAQQRVDRDAFFNKVGGKNRWDAALEWGRNNYSPDQVRRFNEAVNGGDPIARDEAVDALMGRYSRVSPPPGRRGPPRRGAAPERSVATQASPGTGAAGATYPTRDAYQDAYGKAAAKLRNATGSAQREARAALEKVREDGRASQKSWTN